MYEVFQHMDHVPLWHDAALDKPVDWDKIFDGYVSGVDWPVGAYWKEISEAYPDSIILLSTRDPEKWWNSANETIFQSIGHRDEEFAEWHAMIDAMMTNRFHHDLTDKDACIKAFNRHNEEVRKNAPKDRLVEWQPGDGWEPICNALGIPVPSEPFPHANSKEEFLERVKARQAEKAGA